MMWAGTRDLDSIVEAKGMGKEYQEGGRERERERERESERPRSSMDKKTSGEKGENPLDFSLVYT